MALIRPFRVSLLMYVRITISQLCCLICYAEAKNTETLAEQYSVNV